MSRRPLITLALAGTATIVSASLATVTGVSAASTANSSAKTTSPIKHVVVLFQENVSFDHYFGTYPKATNSDGQPFKAKPGTPTVNGLTTALLTANPNGVNPKRLGAANVLTCDQNHDYTPEQQALDGGLVDKFPTYTQVESCSAPDTAPPGLVMDYYDGNTVTALWNYAQRFAMSDNNFDTTFGPSTPGVLNLVSGQTHGATPAVLAGVTDNGTVYGDADPTFDECSAGSTIAMAGTNIGNELNARHVTWGWFQGGFAPTSQVNGTVVCGASHTNIGGAAVTDYSAHHDPFQYYASTANPAHLPPATAAEVGHGGQANHQYDLSYFYQSLTDGNLPAVSFVKSPRYQDGHAGYSDPTDEQTYLVNTINAIEQSKFWKSTAIIITYDDFGRLVRPGDAADRQRLDVRRGCVDGNRALRLRHAGRWVRGSLRLRTAPAAPRGLAIRAHECDRPLDHRHHLCSPIHRGQLVATAHRWRLIRFARRQHQRHVQLQRPGCESFDSQSGNR